MSWADSSGLLQAEVDRLSSEKGALDAQLAEARSTIAAGQAQATEQSIALEKLKAE